MRFTIRSMMIAIVAVAGLLVALRAGAVYAFLMLASLLAWCPAVAVGAWRAGRPYRYVCALAFGIAATLSIAVCLVASLALPVGGLVVKAIILLACVLGTPVIFSFGAAWCTAATRDGAVPRRPRALAWTIAVGLSIAPATVLFTHWPFRVAFLASQPSLERLADQVAAGMPISTPQRAGMFRIVGSVVDPTTGNVGLITDPNPGGRAGFERRDAGTPTRGPFQKLFFDVQLTETWRYVEED